MPSIVGRILGGGAGVAVQNAGPSGLVTAITATGFSVQVESITALAGSTIYLQTRARGSAAAWTTRASAMPPVLSSTLSATGLTQGVPLQWRLVQIAGFEIDEGTISDVTPDASLWPTILSTLRSALEGLGLTVYEGLAPPSNYPALLALMLTRPEVVRRSASSMVALEYPVEVETRVTATSDTGELQTQAMATYQRGMISALDRKGAGTYPGIPGLELVTVEIRAKDDARADVGQELRGRTLVRFLINEART